MFCCLIIFTSIVQPDVKETLAIPTDFGFTQQVALPQTDIFFFRQFLSQSASRFHIIAGSTLLCSRIPIRLWIKVGLVEGGGQPLLRGTITTRSSLPRVLHRWNGGTSIPQAFIYQAVILKILHFELSQITMLKDLVCVTRKLLCKSF